MIQIKSMPVKFFTMLIMLSVNALAQPRHVPNNPAAQATPPTPGTSMNSLSFPLCSSSMPAGALCVNRVGGEVSRVVSVKQVKNELSVLTRKLTKRELTKVNDLYSSEARIASTGEMMVFDLENGIKVVPPCATGMPVGMVCMSLNGKFAKVKATKEGKTIFLKDQKTASFVELSAEEQVRFREEMIRQTTRREVEMEFMEKEVSRKKNDSDDASGCTKQGNKMICGDGVYVKQSQGVSDSIRKHYSSGPANPPTEESINEGQKAERGQ